MSSNLFSKAKKEIEMEAFFPFSFVNFKLVDGM